MLIRIHAGPNGQCNEYDYVYSLQIQQSISTYYMHMARHNSFI